MQCGIQTALAHILAAVDFLHMQGPMQTALACLSGCLLHLVHARAHAYSGASPFWSPVTVSACKGSCMQGLMQNSPASPFWSPVTVSACKGSCTQPCFTFWVACDSQCMQGLMHTALLHLLGCRQPSEAAWPFGSPSACGLHHC